MRDSDLYLGYLDLLLDVYGVGGPAGGGGDGRPRPVQAVAAPAPARAQPQAGVAGLGGVA